MRHLVVFALLSVWFSACSSSSPSTDAEQKSCACDRGVCDPTTGACVDPWVLDCKGVAEGECAPSRPYVCAGVAPPSYDCAKCGCPDGQKCELGVCFPGETLALRREDRGIKTDRPVDEYFRFVDAMMTLPALTKAEAIDEMTKRMKRDARVSTLNLGESHGAGDEQAVGLDLVRAIVSRGFTASTIGIEGGKDPIVDIAPLADLGIEAHAISGDLTNKAYCKAVTENVGELLNTEGIYVQYSGSGHTSQEACYHTEHYSICNPPHTAECVTKLGRRALTVMLFDPDPWLTMTDQALLWRAGTRLPDVAAFATELDAALRRWEASFAKQIKDARFDAAAGARNVNVRFVASPRFEDVFIAYFPRPERTAFLMRSFGAVWATPALQTYLVTNAMRPQDCSISWDATPGKETYSLWCEKDGKELTATVDRDFKLTDSTTK
jgi:hypothetical protein